MTQSSSPKIYRRQFLQLWSVSRKMESPVQVLPRILSNLHSGEELKKLFSSLFSIFLPHFPLVVKKKASAKDTWYYCIQRRDFFRVWRPDPWYSSDFFSMFYPDGVIDRFCLNAVRNGGRRKHSCFGFHAIWISLQFNDQLTLTLWTGDRRRRR